MLPKAFKSCPKPNKSPNLVTLLASFNMHDYGVYYIKSVVAGGAVCESQRSADEVILDVDNDEAAHGTKDLKWIPSS